MFELVAEQSQLAYPACHHLPAGLELLVLPPVLLGGNTEVGPLWMWNFRDSTGPEARTCAVELVGWDGKVGAKSVIVSLFVGLLHLTGEVKQ